MRSHDIKYTILAGLFGGWAIVMPILFHVFSLGSIFLPLFIPLAIASFVLPLGYVVSLAVLVPVISFVISGMPPLIAPPVGLLMMIELLVLMLGNNIFFKRFGVNPFLASFVSTFLSRVSYLFLLFFVSKILGLPSMTFTLIAAIKPLPGIIILITIVPLIVIFMNKHPQLKRVLNGDV